MDIFAIPMRFRDPKTWWILSLLPQGLYTVSIKLHIIAKKVINISSTNILGTIQLSYWVGKLNLPNLPEIHSRFKKKKKKARCPKARVRWPMHHCLLTESLPQWSLIDIYHQVGPNVELNNNWAGEVPVDISLIVGCLLAGPRDALSNCCARPVA